MMPMKGRKEHVARLRKLSGSEVTRVLGAVAYEGADTIRAEAFRSVSAGSVSGAGHIASLPGEPPNRDTGDLQASMEANRTRPLTAEFRTNAGHAVPLEFGTSRMAARPFVRPARDKMLPEVRRTMVKRIDALVKRSG